MKNTDIFQKNKAIVSRLIGEETILLPVCKNSEEINCIYSLNEAASEIWKLIDGKKQLSAIKEAVVKKFDVTPAEVDKELHKLLRDLLVIKAVTVKSK
jgi:hypothetical protein